MWMSTVPLSFRQGQPEEAANVSGGVLPNLHRPPAGHRDRRILSGFEELDTTVLPRLDPFNSLPGIQLDTDLGLRAHA